MKPKLSATLAAATNRQPRTSSRNSAALFARADKEGSIEVGAGVWLNSEVNMLADQRAWDEGDASKTEDFTTAPYWITTDDGQGPTAICDADDLRDALGWPAPRNKGPRP